MRKYETIFILDNRVEEEKREALAEKFKGVIESGGTIDKLDVWGLRKLAYIIDYQTEGHYYLVNFTSNTDVVAELDRNYRISEGVLRHLIINKEDK